MRCWLGVDPGLSGAIATYWPLASDQASIAVYDIPVSAGIIDTATLASMIRPICPNFAIVERVHSMPGQGVSSTFKFGAAFGSIIGVLGALEIPYYFVAPTKWKCHFGLNSDKDASRSLAIRRFPKSSHLFSLKRHHNRAEAALLALYGAEIYK